MQKATIVVNSYIGALLITIIGGGAALIITNVANNVAYADYAIIDPQMEEMLRN